MVRLSKHKDDLAKVIPECTAKLEISTGKLLHMVRTDRGGEYVNASVKSFWDSKGISSQTTLAYTPQQNGKAERLNRTLLEKVRAMLSDAVLPPRLWAEAVVTANYLRNVSPVAGKDKTPWELFFDSVPDLSRLCAFGAKAFVHAPKQ